MTLRKTLFAAIAAATLVGAAQAQHYGYRGHGHGYRAPIAPACTVVQTKTWVFGYGWVYRETRVCT
jgi:hypothetical protein